MKKLVFLLMTSLALISCGDDDSNSGSGLKPATVTISGGGTPTIYTLSYDSKNRIQSVNEGGNNSVFSYTEDNKVDRITTGADYIQFTYAANGNLVSVITDDGQDYNVSQTGDDTFDFGGTPITLNNAGDWASVGTVSLTYSSAKGSFANVKHLDNIALQFVMSSSYFYAHKKRVTSVASGGTDIPIVSAQGEKGLPASYTIESSIVSFTYN
ncbi:hypothetical protein [Flavobacterium selenitireducens]|uniref:hypothetical protein n=1 Tax=Flavobacterium selenitireducens TaxID=2722704 RepID=UPI00168A6D1E|nr:hypothetical protein [Flavobacterium selenitireducens]MBD3583000.1 hypothetical protein [Flavobacterium selenitireducens]